MSELIAGLKESWKQKAENKGLKLSIEMKNMPKQTFNEVLGATIFDNLVFNSIHYTDKGSVTVIVDEDQAIIRDTGIGIKEEDREKVFDRGFRAGQGGRGHYQGFGLGLAISNRAAEALGWSISLKSEVGKGTDFVIRFRPNSVDEINGNQQEGKDEDHRNSACADGLRGKLFVSAVGFREHGNDGRNRQRGS